MEHREAHVNREWPLIIIITRFILLCTHWINPTSRTDFMQTTRMGIYWGLPQWEKWYVDFKYVPKWLGNKYNREYLIYKYTDI